MLRVQSISRVGCTSRSVCRSPTLRHGAGRAWRSRGLSICRTSEDVEPTPTGEVKKWKVMGMDVLESDADLPEPQEDFWSGDRMEAVNTMMKAYLPMMFVAALLCGGVAAKFFNDGASVFIKPAASDDALPETFYETPEGFVPAEENPLFK